MPFGILKIYRQLIVRIIYLVTKIYTLKIIVPSRHSSFVVTSSCRSSSRRCTVALSCHRAIAPSCHSPSRRRRVVIMLRCIVVVVVFVVIAVLPCRLVHRRRIAVLQCRCVHSRVVVTSLCLLSPSSCRRRVVMSLSLWHCCSSSHSSRLHLHWIVFVASSSSTRRCSPHFRHVVVLLCFCHLHRAIVVVIIVVVRHEGVRGVGG
jgi:hypothetical protein